MVLFVFVIMLLNVRTEEARQDRVKYLKIVTPLLFGVLLVEVFFIARSVTTAAPLLVTKVGEHPYGTIENIGEAMFSNYLFPFEATSVLILMAMVGALVLARKRSAQEIETLGKILEDANKPSIEPAQPIAELEEKQHELAA
jgi:NADH-quinone oxidoreductase subunit J